MSDPRRSPALERIGKIRQRLTEALPRVDPHRRLVGRPVTYRLIDGTTLEITFRDVTAIADAELLGAQRLIGGETACTVTPQTAETVTVRFVVAIEAARAEEPWQDPSAAAVRLRTAALPSQPNPDSAHRR